MTKAGPFSLRLTAAVLTGLGVWTPPDLGAQQDLDRDVYARAERFLPWYRDRVLFNAELDVFWIEGTEALWYKSASERGWEFVLARPTSGIKGPAFDHQRMASALSQATGSRLDPTHLPITRLEFRAGLGATPRVTVGSKDWDCDLERSVCAVAPGTARALDRAYSPNGRYAVFAKGPDLWVQDLDSGRDRPLTAEGDSLHAYGAVPGLAGPVVRQRMGQVFPPTGWFSPDGSKFLTYRLDESKAPELSLVQYVPAGDTARPKVWTYRIPLANDPPVTARLVLIDLVTGTPIQVDHPPSAIEFRTPLALRQVEWSRDGRSLYFVDFSDDLREVGLFRTELATGRTSRILDERAETNLVSYFTPRFGLLPNGDIIWPSQRSGWQQLYYYDRDGRLIRPITEGDWVVREVLRIDAANRTVTVSGGGREPDLDPYLRQVYQVGLDGQGIRRIAAEPADHQVRVGGAQFVRLTQEVVPSGFSPSGRYFVDSYSRVDLPTVTVVRDRTGRAVMTLETARLEAEFSKVYVPPRPFQALGADGKTTIYGVLLEPSTLDRTKRYPVLDAVYGGPQTTWVPKRYGADLNNLNRPYVELGGVVTLIDGRNSPLRSRAFFDAGYGKLGKAGFLEDHVAAIREIARTRPYLDLERVGVFGYSAGGYAVVRAMFDDPDFYRVGIETALYDPMLNEWSWGQKYMGPYDGEAYARQSPSFNVANFKGKLFLAVGDVDDVVHPAATMRVVDQLIRHDKDFDLLVVPNQDHNLIAFPYLIRKQWDYFVTHLLLARPPTGYRIAPPGG